MKKFVLIFFITLSQLINAQLKEYSFDEINTLVQKKPIIVFLHTDWCRACSIMKTKTLSNQEVINKLNSDYYFVSFNAESKEDILFNAKIYKPSTAVRGAHDLAMHLGKYRNKLSYPTMVVLSKKNEIVFQNTSVLAPKNLIRLLKDIEHHEKL